jgi:hypothetical protein
MGVVALCFSFCHSRREPAVWTFQSAKCAVFGRDEGFVWRKQQLLHGIQNDKSEAVIKALLAR